jgi:tetratricopeptide (TPR) repeat protein
VASEVREALGDTTPESEKLAAAETFTASSLDAARFYAMAQELGSNAKYQESIEYYKRAIDADPKFGRAYAAWAVSAYQLGRTNEAEDLYKKSFELLDRMTEREKYRTLGAYYLSVAGNYEQAVDNYSKLVTLYPADRGGHTNLALSYFYTMNFAKAMEEGRRALDIYPASPKFRSNYALYAMYAADFETAAREATALTRQDPSYYRAYLPIAVAAIAGGHPDAARSAYETMRDKGGVQGTSLAYMGLADLSVYYGRTDEAIATLRAGIEHDRRIKTRAGLAAKQIALGEALLARDDRDGAAAAVGEAASLTKEPQALLAIARVLARSGHKAQAKEIASDLGQRLQPHARAHGQFVTADLAFAESRPADGVAALLEGRKLADFWFGRFMLGVAYVEEGHYAEAIAELEACEKRRGEATAFFFGDLPTMRYLAPLPYWLGRARQGLGLSTQARQDYNAFLSLRKDAPDDPLAADARRRLTN